jgi:hypothetical protein
LLANRTHISRSAVNGVFGAAIVVIDPIAAGPHVYPPFGLAGMVIGEVHIPPRTVLCADNVH